MSSVSLDDRLLAVALIHSDKMLLNTELNNRIISLVKHEKGKCLEYWFLFCDRAAGKVFFCYPRTSVKVI